MELSDFELQELILSVWSCLSDGGSGNTRFDDRVDDILNDFTQRYDKNSFGDKKVIEDSNNLLDKLFDEYDKRLNS